tara:strand:+ start:110 stop:451 length:342 start_codon:yes stop_codon:yes gene_type:complete
MNKPIPIHYFSDVPNNKEGAEFIRLARKFLNRKRYRLRVLGRGARKVNGAKNSLQYSSFLPHQFSERFSLYIDDLISRYEIMDRRLEAWEKEKVRNKLIAKHMENALAILEGE